MRVRLVLQLARPAPRSQDCCFQWPPGEDDLTRLAADQGSNLLACFVDCPRGPSSLEMQSVAGLPYHSEKKGSIFSTTRGSQGVVAL